MKNLGTIGVALNAPAIQEVGMEIEALRFHAQRK
jgi:hypothetical protein